MSDKLIPKSPEKVMSIRELIPGITTLSVPFARGGLIKVGGRGTIVKLSSGNLAVFSPVALTPDVQTTVQKLGGNVSYIVAPDIEHHIFLSAWAAAFPSAHLIAPEGLPEKRAKSNATNKEITLLDFKTVFTKASKATTRVSEEFDHDFETEFVDAHPNKELVFFHKPTKTLIEADLMFNLPATEQYSKTGEDARAGFLTKLFAGIATTQGTAKWHKRLLWYGFSKADRPGFDASVQRIHSWNFENIVPCHGDSIVGDGKGVFEKVFEWHLQGKKAQA